MRSYLILSLFSFFLVDCASKGRVSPLTYRSGVEAHSYFSDLSDDICDLSTLEASAEPFQLYRYTPTDELRVVPPPRGDVRVFSQNFRYKMHCADRLEKKVGKGGESKEMDLIDSLFEYYEEHYFPTPDRDQSAWIDGFFMFVNYFQKKLLNVYDEGKKTDLLKLVKEDLVKTYVPGTGSEVQRVSPDKITMEVGRNYWINHVFRTPVGQVAGITETKGLLTLERIQEGNSKKLIVSYETTAPLVVPASCPGCRKTVNLKNTKKIKEWVEMIHTPSDEESALNFEVLTKRTDVAVKVVPGFEGEYSKESNKFFIKVVGGTVVDAFSHFARYLIFQTPAGFRDLLHGEVTDLLSRSVVKNQNGDPTPILVRENGHEILVTLQSEDRLSLSLPNEAAQDLILDFDIPSKSFSNVGGQFFHLIANLGGASVVAPWDDILGAPVGSDFLMKRIRAEDGLLILNLFPKREIRVRGEGLLARDQVLEVQNTLVLSRPIYHRDLLKEVERLYKKGKSVTHKPMGATIQFVQEDQIRFESLGDNSKVFTFSIEVLADEFSNREKSFAFVLTPVDGADRASYDDFVNENGLRARDAEGRPTLYLGFDKSDGLLLKKKFYEPGGERWEPIFLAKKTHFPGYKKYKALKEALAEQEGEFWSPEWEAHIQWNKTHLLASDRRDDPTYTAYYEFEVLEDSFREESESFSLKLTLNEGESRLPEEGEPFEREKTIRAKLEGEEVHFDLSRPRDLRARAQVVEAWIGLSRDAKYQGFKRDLRALNTNVLHENLERLISFSLEPQGEGEEEKLHIHFATSRIDGPRVKCEVSRIDKESFREVEGLSFEVRLNCEERGENSLAKEIMAFPPPGEALSFTRRIKKVGPHFFLEIPGREGNPSHWLALNQKTLFHERPGDFMRSVRGRHFTSNNGTRNFTVSFMNEQQVEFRRTGRVLRCDYELDEQSHSLGDGFSWVVRNCDQTGGSYRNLFNLPGNPESLMWRLKKKVSDAQVPSLRLRRLFRYPDLHIGKITAHPGDWLRMNLEN